jgi:arylsulfatase A-like enzyme
MKRPNILLFITDQHRADYLGCYGHPVLKTPHIDSIAARGVRFERFYVATFETGRGVLKDFWPNPSART